MGRLKRQRREQDASQPTEAPSPKENQQENKQEVRVEKKSSRYSFKVDHTNAKAMLQQAKANKWKWLSILIGAAIAAYMAFKSKIFGG